MQCMTGSALWLTQQIIWNEPLELVLDDKLAAAEYCLLDDGTAAYRFQ